MNTIHFVCKRVTKVPPFWKKVYLFTNGDIMFQKKGFWYFYIKRSDGSIYCVNADFFVWSSVRIKAHYE